MKKIKVFINQWALLLVAVLSLFLIIIFHNKAPKNYSKWRYEIRGQVIHQGKPHDAIWYTDTIEIGDNYCKYKNSDGSEVVIPAPYVLIDHKYDRVKKDTVPAF